MTGTKINEDPGVKKKKKFIWHWALNAQKNNVHKGKTKKALNNVYTISKYSFF